MHPAIKWFNHSIDVSVTKTDLPPILHLLRFRCSIPAPDNCEVVWKRRVDHSTKVVVLSSVASSPLKVKSAE